MPHEFHPKRSLESHCTLSWEIPERERDKLDVYFLLHWHSSRFLNQPRWSEVIHNDITYSVLFHKCLPNLLRSYTGILLSFRRITGQERGYVLIRPELGTHIGMNARPLDTHDRE